MIKFNQEYFKKENHYGKDVFHFNLGGQNIDVETVDSFGEEWEKFGAFSKEDIDYNGSLYFDIIDKKWLANKNVLDVGCGTGRWMHYISSFCNFVDGVDPSKAVYSATKLLQEKNNIRISIADVDNLPFDDESFDLVYSLGVLHHIPNTRNAMENCVKKVKKGGYFLVYLYYNLDNRGPLFKALFFASNLVRNIVSKLPSTIKKIVADLLAVIFYLPFVFIAKMLTFFGFNKIAKKIPLYYYSKQSWNIIRNDSLDRFGTPLEQRFSKKQIEEMMASCGLSEIKFSEIEPYWHAIGKKN